MSEEKKFRISTKKLFLTYPQCDVSKNDLLSYLKEKGHIVTYYIGCEKHEDGNLHLHAAVHYSVKIDTRDERFFDYKGFHPNVQSARNWSSVCSYCSKGGDFITSTELDISDPTNYRKRKEDFNEWQKDMQKRSRVEVKWPLQLPNGATFDPSTMEKKRHLWLVSKPDYGKTTWIQNTFEGQKVFLRAKTKYPYDSYEGQQVIIFDDIFPTWDEIAAVSITYKIESTVFGDTRYRNVYWPLKVNMVMIVLANHPPNYGSHDEAFNARFNVIYLE